MNDNLKAIVALTFLGILAILFYIFYTDTYEIMFYHCGKGKFQFENEGFYSRQINTPKVQEYDTPCPSFAGYGDTRRLLTFERKAASIDFVGSGIIKVTLKKNDVLCAEKTTSGTGHLSVSITCNK